MDTILLDSLQAAIYDTIQVIDTIPISSPRTSEASILLKDVMPQILISISIVFTGLFSLYKYLRRNEQASLKIEISKTELIKNPDTHDNYLYAEISVINNGTREVRLYYNYIAEKEIKTKVEKLNKKYQAQLKVYKLDENEERIEIVTKIGMDSKFPKPPNTGRLRSGANIILPYICKLATPGIYFIEFSIDVNMVHFFRGKDFKDEPIKQWSNRIYKLIEFD